MLWEVDIYAASGQPDLAAERIRASAADLGLTANLAVRSASGFLVEGPLDEAAANRIARDLLADRIVERTVVARVGDERLAAPPGAEKQLVHVLMKPGV